MEDNGTLNILDLYVKANNNKDEIVLETKDGEQYSKAEMVVLSCMAMIVREGEDKTSGIDYDRVIKTIILNSLDGNLDNLKKKDEYNRLIKASKEVETEEGYGAKLVYERMISDFKTYLNPVFTEEEFIFRNLKLHENKRIGHIYWGLKSDRIESVLEHIYGCLVLTIGLESEYDYYLDYSKLRKMLIIHETGEIIEKDKTVWDESKEERENNERRAVHKILSTLPNGDKLIELWEEFETGISLTSSYGYVIDKMEYDLKVKMNEKQGKYDFTNIPKNVATESKEVKDIIASGASSVFEVHYEYDKDKYSSIPVFRRLLEDAKKY